MAVYYIADRTVMQLTDRSGATVPEARCSCTPFLKSSALKRPGGICPTSDCTSPSMRQAPTSWWPSPTEAPPTAGASLALVLTAVGLGALGPAVF